MIDLHCHILPGLDDGPAELAESLKMCALAARDGITDLVATPHFQPDKYTHGLPEIRQAVVHLSARVAEAGIPLRLYPGGDVALDGEMLSWARDKTLPTLADNGRYFLMEPPDPWQLRGLEEMVFELQLLGLTPVITHPERIQGQGKSWGWLERLVDLGCLSQVTAMSLTGRFGKAVRRSSLELLERNLVHLVATDAHSPERRPPVLSEALHLLLDKAGEERTRLMFKEWPQAVLEGRSFEVPSPDPPPRRRRFFFF